jgi:hypothetical protein
MYLNTMFIFALFTIAKVWKQPKCPHTDEQTKKICYLYTMEFHLATKKNENFHLLVNGWIW